MGRLGQYPLGRMVFMRKVFEPALGEFEQVFLSIFERLRKESEQRVHLPPDVMTVRHRSITFRLLARAGSTMHALLQVPHNEFPFRLFTMLSDPTVEPDLSESLNTRCELGDRSEGIKNVFNVVLGNAESMVGCGSSHVAFTGIVQTEQRHAALRRRLRVMAPTHPAMWLRTSHSGPIDTASWSASKYMRRMRQRRRRKPNIWPAFVKERTMRQKRLDFRSLAKGPTRSTSCSAFGQRSTDVLRQTNLVNVGRRHQSLQRDAVPDGGEPF